VDGDDVPNAQDISPHLHNLVIYLSPFLLLILGAGLLFHDIMQHRVVPAVAVDLPATLRENDMLARATVTAHVTGGPYRGLVCTVTVDGATVDYFTSPGTYEVMLGGRSRGVHRISARLQVAQRRYGTAERVVEETFLVEPSPSVSGKGSGEIIDADALVPGIEALFEDDQRGGAGEE
jgi:hypothetical protein